MDRCRCRTPGTQGTSHPDLRERWLTFLVELMPRYQTTRRTTATPLASELFPDTATPSESSLAVPTRPNHLTARVSCSSASTNNSAILNMDPLQRYNAARTADAKAEGRQVSPSVPNLNPDTDQAGCSARADPKGTRRVRVSSQVDSQPLFIALLCPDHGPPCSWCTTPFGRH
jgi:hypothetical protein